MHPDPTQRAVPLAKSRWVAQLLLLFLCFSFMVPYLSIGLDDFIDFSWILTLQFSLKEENEQAGVSGKRMSMCKLLDKKWAKDEDMLWNECMSYLKIIRWWFLSKHWPGQREHTRGEICPADLLFGTAGIECHFWDPPVFLLECPLGLPSPWVRM